MENEAARAPLATPPDAAPGPLAGSGTLLYMQVYDDLRRAIEQGDYPNGTKLPAEKELLATYGVSSITLRRALEMLRSDGLVLRRPRLGTVVTYERDQASRRPADLPLVAFMNTAFNDAFGTAILEGATDAALHRSSLLLARTAGDMQREDDLLEEVLAAGAQGLIFLPSRSMLVPRRLLELVARRFPVVLLDKQFEGLPVATVASDHSGGAELATDYLFGLGHRRIGLVTSGRSVISNEERRAGWIASHARHAVRPHEVDEFHNLAVPGSPAPERMEEDLTRLTHFLTSSPETTAFLAGEYTMALMLREALRRVERTVPEDVSIVCFDSPRTPGEDLRFTFTHIAQQQTEIGRIAVEEVLTQIGSGAAETKRIVPTTLVLGNSTAPARG